MIKFLDTSNLATYQSGKYKGKYDWSNNIGKELYFEYDGLSGHIKIVNYKKAIPNSKITLQYKDNTISTTTPNLLHLKIPSLFGKEKQSEKYKYNVGDKIKKFNDTLEILEQIRIKYDNSSNRGYKVRCCDCNYEYETLEQTLSTCPVCGKRTSYSERFIFSLLKQIGIKFIPQKEFNWLPNRFYDCYLPKYNAIIEIHGKQHYKPIKLNHNETPQETYEHTITSDKLKYDAATQNKVIYYAINASNQETLFQEAKNILSFINFTSISELECEKFANYKSIIKECELWNKGFSLEEIHHKLKTPIQSIQSKLRLGNKYEMCTYSKEINMHYHKIINPNRAS